MENFSVELFFLPQKKDKGAFQLSTIVPAARAKDILKTSEKIARHFEKRAEDRGREVSYQGVLSAKRVEMINHNLMLIDSNVLSEQQTLKEDFNLSKKVNILGWFVTEALYSVKAQDGKKKLLARSLVYCNSIKKKKIIDEVESALDKKALLKKLGPENDKAKFKKVVAIRPVYQGIFLTAFDKRKSNETEIAPLLKTDLVKLFQ